MLRTTIVFTGLINGPGYMRHHWMNTEDPTGAGEVRTRIAAFMPLLSVCVGSGCSFSFDGNIEIINPINGHQTGLLTVTPVSDAGAASGGLVAPQLNGLIQWRTGQFDDTPQGSRERRGRTYVPSVAGSSNSSGVPTAAYRTALLAAATALYGTAPSKLGVWSKVHGTISNVSSVSTWSKWATMNSRRD